MRPPENRHKLLTDRELQVIALIGEGKTSKEIAGLLKLSPLTVANHRKHICEKLGLHSTAALVAHAAQTLTPDK